MAAYKINSKEELECFITQNWNQVNEYLDGQCSVLPVPIYSSVDIRESRHKFAPVDHNIYPAGFNNVCALDLEACSRAFEKAIKKIDNSIKRIAIIPESNTKNTFYLDHLAFLARTLADAGFEVGFVGLDMGLFPDGIEHLELISFSKFEIKISKGTIVDGKLSDASGAYDLAILNNDQSDPLKVDWDSLSTPICPTPKIGWFKRQKIKHFSYYNHVADAFCAEFSINPDLIQARFRNEENVDFSTKEGLERLGGEVDKLLSELPAGSSVFVKASQGTYGMGISVVKSGEEVINMNRKSRNKMDIGKNKIKFTSVLIQEGIETVLKYEDMPAEVAIYLVDGKALGGFMRANSEKDAFSNLNARGMVFKKYCISEIRENNDYQAKEAVYSVIARLATLASAHEIKEVLS